MARKLSVKQAAELAGCHQETIRRAIRSKELLATRSPVGVGRSYTILDTDLAAFLEKRRLG